MKVFQKYITSRERRARAKDIKSSLVIWSFKKDWLISKCLRTLLRPKAEIEDLFVRLTKLEVFLAIKEEPGMFRWNYDISSRLFGD